MFYVLVKAWGLSIMNIDSHMLMTTFSLSHDRNRDILSPREHYHYHKTNQLRPNRIYFLDQM